MYVQLTILEVFIYGFSVPIAFIFVSSCFYLSLAYKVIGFIMEFQHVFIIVRKSLTIEPKLALNP